MFTQNEKNRVFVILTTIESKKSLFDCVQIDNNDDNYSTCANNEKFEIYDINTS